MTKVMKIMAVVVLAIVLTVSFASSVWASGDEVSFGDFGTQDLMNDAKDTTGAARKINKIMGSILTIVQVIGMGVAVIMLIVLAIKYISAAPGDKADIKKHAVVYVVGAVVLFGASGILQVVKNFAGNLNN